MNIQLLEKYLILVEKLIHFLQSKFFFDVHQKKEWILKIFLVIKKFLLVKMLVHYNCRYYYHHQQLVLIIHGNHLKLQQNMVKKNGILFISYVAPWVIIFDNNYEILGGANIKEVVYATVNEQVLKFRGKDNFQIFVQFHLKCQFFQILCRKDRDTMVIEKIIYQIF